MFAVGDVALRCGAHSRQAAASPSGRSPVTAPRHWHARRIAQSRQKRTRAQAGDADRSEPDAPWEIGLYISKRPSHKTDKLGVIAEETMDNLIPLPGWNAAGKQKLAATVVAKELGVEVSFVEARIEELKILLPDMASRIGTMKTADLCRLAMRVPDVAASLVRLKGVFPNCDVAKMCAMQPELLSQDPSNLAERLAMLRKLLPTIDVDSLVTAAPRVLHVEKTAAAIAELQRLMPSADVPWMVARDPDMLLSVQKGDDLIPYDNGTLAQIKESLAGGPDAAPEGW